MIWKLAILDTGRVFYGTRQEMISLARNVQTWGYTLTREN